MENRVLPVVLQSVLVWVALFFSSFPAFGVDPIRIKIDSAWAATTVSFSAISVGNKVYVGYYDASRYMVMVEVDLSTGALTKARLPFRFDGWDAHKNIVLADDGKELHIAGGMHATPLIYARTTKNRSLNSIEFFNSMIGKNEDRVTYPKFLIRKNGTLVFWYRDGGSGNGRFFFNVYQGGTWRRLHDGPIFGAGLRNEPASAYPTDIAVGPDDAYHIAWTWRLSPDVASNFDICYIKSYDLETWLDSGGKKVSLPLQPGEAVVDRVPVRSGVYNNLKLGFNASGNAVISYTKYDENGNSQLFHAIVGDNTVVHRSITNWVARWDFIGSGSLPTRIGFSGVRLIDGKLTEEVQHWLNGSWKLTYDDNGLTMRDKVRAARSPGTSGMVKMRSPIRSFGGSDIKGSLVWDAMPASNRDQPYSCDRNAKGGQVCKFESDLVLEIDAPAKKY